MRCALPEPARADLSSVLFEVTDRCNLSCLYCYNVHKRPFGAPSAVSTFERARATLVRLFEIARVGRVTMSGGEPFLAERFDELVAFCLSHGKEVLVTSNGNGGSLAELEALITMGVRTFVFPLHSANPDEHDQMTGVEGSWQKALASLRRAKQLGAMVMPIIVLTRFNFKSAADTLLFLKKNDFRRIIVNRLNYGGQGIREAARLALTITEIKEVFFAVNDLAVKCGLWLSSNICTPHCVLNPRDYPRIGFGVCDLNTANRPITLDAAGDVRFCNHSPVIMGNIFSSSVQEILSTEYANRWRDTVPEHCADCALWKQCAGGCRAAAEQLGYDMCEVDPIAWPVLSPGDRNRRHGAVLGP